MMLCPKCGNKSKVLWVRFKKDFTIRSRECTNCKHKFSTKEMESDGWDYKSVVDKMYNELREVKRKGK